jgi:hypothetical protein
MIIRVARMLGWWAYHTHDSRRSAEGFPDLVLVGPQPDGTARLIFAEVKGLQTRVTPAQKAWLEALGQTSAEVYLWREGDISLQQITNLLERG